MPATTRSQRRKLDEAALDEQILQNLNDKLDAAIAQYFLMMRAREVLEQEKRREIKLGAKWNDRRRKEEAHKKEEAAALEIASRPPPEYYPWFNGIHGMHQP